MFDIDPYRCIDGQRWTLRNDRRASEAPCRWPLPQIGGHDPIAVPEPNDPRKGVDLRYDHDFGGELFVPVFAVQRGEVVVACETPSGFAVTLDHGAWCTHYAHLSRMFVTRRASSARWLAQVKPGEVIGYASKAPFHNVVAQVSKRKRAACHAHLRRYFHEALPTAPIPRVQDHPKRRLTSCCPGRGRGLAPLISSRRWSDGYVRDAQRARQTVVTWRYPQRTMIEA